jgi:hypothetical protein
MQIVGRGSQMRIILDWCAWSNLRLHRISRVGISRIRLLFFFTESFPRHSLPAVAVQNLELDEYEAAEPVERNRKGSTAEGILSF